MAEHTSCHSAEKHAIREHFLTIPMSVFIHINPVTPSSSTQGVSIAQCLSYMYLRSVTPAVARQTSPGQRGDFCTLEKAMPASLRVVCSCHMGFVTSVESGDMACGCQMDRQGPL